MVTIVNDNRPRHRIICKHCGVELEYCDSDIQKKYISGGDGWSYHYEYYEHYINCPACQKRIELRMGGMSSNETEPK